MLSFQRPVSLSSTRARPDPWRPKPGRGILPGEGTASVHTAEPCLEVWKSSRSCEDPLEEPEGVGLGPVHAAGKASAEAVDRVVVDAHEPGGASLDANALPAPTEGTASAKFIGMPE